MVKVMAQGLAGVEIAQQPGLLPNTMGDASQASKEKRRIHRAADISLLAVPCF
jgi:hypothetical protein